MTSDLNSYTGVCECIYEPRGRNGLEGYQRGDVYLYNECLNSDGKAIFQVYSVADDYHDICGKILFNKFFKIRFTFRNILEEHIQK